MKRNEVSGCRVTVISVGNFSFVRTHSNERGASMKKVLVGLLASMFFLYAGTAAAVDVQVDGTLNISGTVTDGIIFPDGTTQTTAATSTLYQQRVTGTCPSGQAINVIYSGGSVNCQTVGSGTVSSVGTASGLTGGPITSTGTISIATSGVTDSMIATGISGSKISGNISGSAASISGSISESQVTNLSTDLGSKVSRAGDTMSGDLSLPSLTLSGNLNLPATTATTGIIKSGTNTLISTYGSNNFFAGVNAGHSNTTGYSNTASGAGALYSNTTANSNTAFGSSALYTQSYNAGYETSNTAVGDQSMYYNQPTSINNGKHNTAIGVQALYSNTTGSGNIAIGYGAGYSQTTGNNNIYIGTVGGVAGESNVIRIGGGSTTYIQGIWNSNVSNPGGVTQVYVDNTGHVGVVLSSRRFKEDIQDMGNTTDGLMRLRPVTFYYKPEYANGSHLLQYGLIAEEVAKVYPDLVAYDDKGEPNTVSYQFVNAMLLNEVQKQHREIENLKERLSQLEALMNRK